MSRHSAVLLPYVPLSVAGELAEPACCPLAERRGTQEHAVRPVAPVGVLVDMHESLDMEVWWAVKH